MDSGGDNIGQCGFYCHELKFYKLYMRVSVCIVNKNAKYFRKILQFTIYYELLRFNVIII